MNENTIAFLEHIFFRAHGYFELVAIHPTRDRGSNIRPFAYDLTRDKVDWQQIEDLNANEWGIYYGTTTARTRPAPGKRRKERDVLTMPCVWVEIDLKENVFADTDAILQHLYAFDYPPSFLINSGGGVHSVWLIDPVTVTHANTPMLKETLRGLAVYLQADTSAQDLARVLRLPSTINTKPERGGVMCEIIDALPGQFTLDDFADYRQYAQPVSRPIERRLPRPRPTDVPPKVQEYLDTSIAPGGRNAALNVAAYVLHSNGYAQSEAERLLVGKAVADGLSERETLRTIQSAYSAPPGTPSYLSRRAVSRIRAGDASDRKIS